MPNKDDKLPDIYGHLQYCYKPLHSGHHWGMKFCPLGPGASAFGTQQSGWCPSGALLYSPSNDTRQRHKFHCCESPHYKHSISHSGVGMGGGGGGLRGLEPPLFLMEPPPPPYFVVSQNFLVFIKRCFVLEIEFCVHKKLEPPKEKHLSTPLSQQECVIDRAWARGFLPK